MGTIFLIIHIISGFTALLVGTTIMITRKGNGRHVQFGRIFFWSMMLVVISAVYLSITKNNGFLLGVGIFVFYQAFAGMRSANKKGIPNKWWDILVLIAAFINAVFMFSTGNVVLIIFASITVLLVFIDLRSYYLIARKKELPKLAWLARHIGMMVGAYIGTLTAFLVVNIQLASNQWMIWLGPTVLFVPLMNYWTWKYTRKKGGKSGLKFLVSVVLFVALQPTSIGQTYIEGGQTRHRFAQLNLGTDLRVFHDNSAQTYTFNANGKVAAEKLGDMVESRFIIGGTHFWGHADFYVAFSLFQWDQSNYSSGVETGARYFPWQIKSGRISPFLGFSWMTKAYQQGNGAYVASNDFPISVGMVYAKNNHLFEIYSALSFQNSQNYYISKDVQVAVTTPKYWFGIGYKFMLETTIGAEKQWKNGETKKLTDELSANKELNGLTIAIGPSSSIYLKKSDYNEIFHPFLGQHQFSNVFVEYGLGYYWHQLDFQFNLAYRHVKSSLLAYGLKQNIGRRAITFEAFKFLGDFHGFAPFLGVGISGEMLRVKEIEGNSTPITYQRDVVRPGIIFGWDIRPNDVQRWYLRTNLRWFPKLNIKHVSGSKINLDQLEFNFIQLVVFPGRFL